MTRNEQARAAAVKAGRPTYSVEVVDHWPACTECGAVIRASVHTIRPGLWRACACDGVEWVCGFHGWERRTVNGGTS